MSVQAALIDANDSYAPTVSRPELQQWDNYQIHDLYCDDIIYFPVIVPGESIATEPPPSEKFRSFLAVEKFNPEATISVNFEAIALAYP